VNINQRTVNSTERFRLLDHDDGSIISDLPSVNIKSKARITSTSVSFNSTSEDGLDSYEYIVTFSPFRIEQKINGVVTVVVNKKDTLMFEDYSRFY